MENLILTGVGLLGLALGSFLSALTYRMPRGKSVVRGRSKCPHCKRKIAWYDNIPIFSYVLLGAKCRSCGGKIHSRYFLIEITTALGFAGVFVLQTLGRNGVVDFGILTLPYLLFLFTIIFAIFIIDLETMVIPDELTFVGFSVSIILLVLFGAPDLYERLLAGFLAGLFLLFIHLITRGKGMGLGDVKLALLAGLVLGGQMTFVWLFLAFLTGAAVGIILILTKKARMNVPIAFGPFLAFSMLVTIFWGNKVFYLLGY